MILVETVSQASLQITITTRFTMHTDFKFYFEDRSLEFSFVVETLKASCGFNLNATFQLLTSNKQYQCVAPAVSFLILSVWAKN